MRLSQLFTKTSKESVSDASSLNADLLVRAGYINKTMAGVYAFLPLGLKVLAKIESIMREEMDKIGQELLMPSLSPTEPWEQTGRLETVSSLYQATPANDASKKSNDARYLLNSTHEEIITPILQRYCSSYKDLPRAVYQIQTKFRNEARPKSGLMRGREFRMKDLYSFHASEEDMMRYFTTVGTPAYTSFFRRVGLGDRTVIALASGGDFSKEPSREFQTICATGEDHLFRVPGTDTIYNREICPSLAPTWGNPDEPEKPRKDVEGKGIVGVEELASFLKIEVERTTKTLLLETDDGSVVAAAVRGGYDVNMDKLRIVLGCTSLALASAATVKKVTGAEVGYAGPIGLPSSVRVLWDDSTRDRKNFECGANKTNEHSTNVNFGRDVPLPEKFYDIKVAHDGDWMPGTTQPYEEMRACEVGNIFTLFTKFSDAFNFTFQDKDGKQKPVFMGCYGIGTSRVMGVIAEVCNDKKGLVWPKEVAPYRAHVVTLARSEDEPAWTEAVSLVEKLEAKGISVLFDDRLDVSAGVKFADADLLGMPTRLVVSKKSLEQGQIEVADRKSGDVQMVAIADVVKALA